MIDQPSTIEARSRQRDYCLTSRFNGQFPSIDHDDSVDYRNLVTFFPSGQLWVVEELANLAAPRREVVVSGAFGGARFNYNLFENRLLRQIPGGK